MLESIFARKLNSLLAMVILLSFGLLLFCSKGNRTSNIEKGGKAESAVAEGMSDANLSGIPCTKGNCADTLFVESDTGAWLQTMPGNDSGKTIVKLPFNAELLTECYAQVEEGEIGGAPYKANWYRVKIDGKEGWVKSTYVTSEKHVYDISFAQYADSLLKRIKSNGPMYAFVRDSLLFEYHEDNRCDGSTDGTVTLNGAKMIDSIMKIGVFRDGKGWEEKCGKDSSHFNLDFDFHKELGEVLSSGDTFAINQFRKTISVSQELHGFDFFIKSLKDRFVIYRIKYENSDPG